METKKIVELSAAAHMLMHEGIITFEDYRLIGMKILDMSNPSKK